VKLFDRPNGLIKTFNPFFPSSVSIGTAARGLDFCDLTGLPPANLLADPDALVYEALGLERGPVAAFLSPATPLAIGKRVAAGGGASLSAALAKWKPWQPPQGPKQALNQGGAWAFKAGGECVWARCDRATADHVEPGVILGQGLKLV
jgi:AhpC/TSA antioxidant enzyme